MLTKSEVGPLVTVVDEGTDQTSDNHNLINHDDPKYSRPWHASSQKQVKEQQRRSDEPVDVTSIVDRTVVSCYLGVAAVELDCDWCKAQVGSHCDYKEPYQYMARVFIV